jgi:hypothetical protein
MKILIRLLIVLILVVGAFMGRLAWERFCIALSGVVASVNGEPFEAVSAQTCPNGLVRVEIPGQTSILVDTLRKDAYFPGTEFHNIFGLTFSHDPNPVGVSFRDRIKIEKDRNVEFTDDSIGYDDLLTDHRIVIKLAK